MRLKEPRGPADNFVGPDSSLTNPGGFGHAWRLPWP